VAQPASTSREACENTVERDHPIAAAHASTGVAPTLASHRNPANVAGPGSSRLPLVTATALPSAIRSS
jgi:hypothetical protein